MSSRIARDDGGFSLIELVVTMFAATLVLFGILGMADTFGGVAAKNTILTESEDNVRMRLNTMSSEIGNAVTTKNTGTPSTIGPVVYRNARDIVVVTSVLTTISGNRIGVPTPVRYCLDTAGKGIVWRGVQTSFANSPSTYSDPGSACAGVAASGWTYTRQYGDVIDATDLFPTPGVLAAGTAAASLSVTVASGQKDNSSKPVPLTLRSGVNVRNAQPVPRVASADFACTANGSSFVIGLRPSASTGPDGQPLTVKYFTNSSKSAAATQTGNVMNVSSATTYTYWVTLTSAAGVSSSAATDIDSSIQVSC